MWHFADKSVLHSCYAVRSLVAKSIWRCPLTCCQLQNFSVAKPALRHASSYIFALGKSRYASTFVGRSAVLLRLCITCARHNGSAKLLQPDRYAFVKQLRHASNTKTFTKPVQQVTKKGLPKASDVSRLLSLAKPEKWKLLGEDVLFYFAEDVLRS